jgi:hypothetical protein
MTLYNDLIAALPELKDSDFVPSSGTILLQNDGDETGDYIAKWEYSKPLPEGMKVGK